MHIRSTGKGQDVAFPHVQSGIGEVELLLGLLPLFHFLSKLLQLLSWLLNLLAYFEGIKGIKRRTLPGGRGKAKAWLKHPDFSINYGQVGKTRYLVLYLRLGFHSLMKNSVMVQSNGFCAPLGRSGW